eukprot:Rhum_TRINITY_DN6427_c0_g12::Rhum_TRINITY_DN6427_c0_g12_i1::g.20067::m.20067
MARSGGFFFGIFLWFFFLVKCWFVVCDQLMRHCHSAVFPTQGLYFVFRFFYRNSFFFGRFVLVFFFFFFFLLFFLMRDLQHQRRDHARKQGGDGDGVGGGTLTHVPDPPERSVVDVLQVADRVRRRGRREARRLLDARHRRRQVQHVHPREALVAAVLHERNRLLVDVRESADLRRVELRPAEHSEVEDLRQRHRLDASGLERGGARSGRGSDEHLALKLVETAELAGGEAVVGDDLVDVVQVHVVLDVRAVAEVHRVEAARREVRARVRVGRAVAHGRGRRRGHEARGDVQRDGVAVLPVGGDDGKRAVRSRQLEHLLRQQHRRRARHLGPRLADAEHCAAHHPARRRRRGAQAGAGQGAAHADGDLRAVAADGKAREAGLAAEGGGGRRRVIRAEDRRQHAEHLRVHVGGLVRRAVLPDGDVRGGDATGGAGEHNDLRAVAGGAHDKVGADQLDVAHVHAGRAEGAGQAGQSVAGAGVPDARREPDAVQGHRRVGGTGDVRLLALDRVPLADVDRRQGALARGRPELERGEGGRELGKRSRNTGVAAPLLRTSVRGNNELVLAVVVRDRGDSGRVSAHGKAPAGSVLVEKAQSARPPAPVAVSVERIGGGKLTVHLADQLLLGEFERLHPDAGLARVLRVRVLVGSRDVRDLRVEAVGQLLVRTVVRHDGRRVAPRSLHEHEVVLVDDDKAGHGGVVSARHKRVGESPVVHDAGLNDVHGRHQQAQPRDSIAGQGLTLELLQTGDLRAVKDNAVELGHLRDVGSRGEVSFNQTPVRAAQGGAALLHKGDLLVAHPRRRHEAHLALLQGGRVLRAGRLQQNLLRGHAGRLDVGDVELHTPHGAALTQVHVGVGAVNAVSVRRTAQARDGVPLVRRHREHGQTPLRRPGGEDGRQHLVDGRAEVGRRVHLGRVHSTVHLRHVLRHVRRDDLTVAPEDDDLRAKVVGRDEEVLLQELHSRQVESRTLHRGLCDRVADATRGRVLRVGDLGRLAGGVAKARVQPLPRAEGAGVRPRVLVGVQGKGGDSRREARHSEVRGVGAAREAGGTPRRHGQELPGLAVVGEAGDSGSLVDVGRKGEDVRVDRGETLGVQLDARRRQGRPDVLSHQQRLLLNLVRGGGCAGCGSQHHRVAQHCVCGLPFS